MAYALTNSTIKLDITVKIELTLEEAKALKQMTAYGAESFLQGYYKQLGKSYMQKHESGIKSLFETIKKTLPNEIEKADKIINAINEIKGI